MKNRRLSSQLGYEPSEVSTITAFTVICMPKRNHHANRYHYKSNLIIYQWLIRLLLTEENY